MKTPENEWHEEVEVDTIIHELEGLDFNCPEARKIVHVSFNSILDQHSAHLVGRLESLKEEETHDEPCDGYCQESACYLPDRIVKNRILDQAIGIIKDNK
jgi:hypothetical protein